MANFAHRFVSTMARRLISSSKDAYSTGTGNNTSNRISLRSILALRCIEPQNTPSNSNSNHAPQVLHRLQSRKIAASPAPVLRGMQVRLVLFRGLPEARLEEAQEDLQASQRGAWRHAGTDSQPYEKIYCYEGIIRK
jgi:hypothetical protein